MIRIIRYLVCVICFISLSASVVAAKPGDTPEKKPSNKKGVGLGRFPDWLGANELKQLNVAWFYNWQSTNSKFTTSIDFIPMIRAGKTAPKLRREDFILGYNEPDHPSQDDISVKEGLEQWPNIVSKGKFIVGPAMCKDPIKNEWLPEFMKAKPKVDAIAVHWYKGVSAKKFIDDMEEIYKVYGLPIWITEFACQTSESSRENPKKFTQDQVNQFIKDSTRWMEKTPWIQRYAWHSSGNGTSCLYDDKGRKLSATGIAYSEVNKESN